MKNGLFFVVSAPSGAGKTTLSTAVINKLKEKHQVSKVITYTSRPRRKGEVDGTDYHFISNSDFLQKEINQYFLETTKYHNYFYGSPSSILEKSKTGKSFVIVTDYKGGKNYLKLLKNPILIWIEPPSLEELEIRLKKRNREDFKKISERLEMAKIEIETERKNKIFHYHVINDNFEKTVSELCKIIENNFTKFRSI